MTVDGLKIIRIWPYAYRAALRQIYNSRPELAQAPHDAHLAFLLDNHHGYGAGFSRSMRRLGYDAHEMITHVVRLHAAWARDHGVTEETPTGNPTAFIDRMILAELSVARPDVVYVQGVSAYTPGFWRAAREVCPSIRLVIGHLGFIFDPTRLENVDFLFLNMRGIDGVGDDLGLPTDVLYHAFDPAAAPADSDALHPFTFCGTTGSHDAQYAERYRMLAALATRCDLRLWTQEEITPWPAGLTPKTVAAQAAAMRRSHPPDEAAQRIAEWIAAAGFQPPVAALFPDQCAPCVFGTEMHRVLASSKITFNTHVGLAHGRAGNMRMFEATGNGACLITDHALNIQELFEPDVEVATYKNLDECVEKVRYLLDHEDERRRMAEAGRKRTLKDHGWDQRATEIDAVIRRLL